MESGKRTVRVRVGDETIDAGALLAEVGRADSGATVLFLGTVRDHSEGRKGVTYLDYEVYAERVEEVIRGIVDDAAVRWSILSVVVEHRSGVVPTGEASVAVVVSAEHRADAFAAARHVIDQLKAEAPIWKKEHWPGGSEWSRGS